MTGAALRIGVAGCAGRMGIMLLRQIRATDGTELAGGAVRPGGALVGRDLGDVAGIEPLGLAATDDAASLFAACDAVIDFTTPEATLRHAALAAHGGKILVVGTTGLDAAQEAELRAASARARIVYAANFSVGVTLLEALVERAARALGPDYDVEIFEMHHRRKIDAPSGTALALGRAAAKGRGVTPKDAFVRARDGLTGPREAGTIGFAAARGGDVIGDHRVFLAGDGEMVELAHRASGRQIYAQGAVRAALWAQAQAPGLYSMRDVIDVG